MKSIIKSLIITAVVFSALTSSYATTYPTIQLVENKTLAVNLNDWANTNVNITIKDIYGTTLHMDRFNSNDIEGRRYNLKYLPNGKYELIIESDMKKAVHSLEVANGTLVVRKSSDKVVFKPTIKAYDNSIDFNQLALGRNIEVTIGDDTGVFFQEKYSDLATINKRYDISKLPRGIYTVTVQGENQYDTYTFVR